MNDPLPAVIPSVVILTPLALLALLVPALFRGWSDTLRRWRVLLLVSTACSALYLAHFALREHRKGDWWATPAAVWVALTLVAAAGLLYAWRRQRAAPPTHPLYDPRPRPIEHAVLALLSLAGIWSTVLCLLIEHPLLHPILVVWLVAWVGSTYQLYLRRRIGRGPIGRPAPAAEVVLLGALTLACAGFCARALAPERTVLWTFVADDRGTIYSSPLAYRGRVYVGAALDQGALPHGELYCLDGETGRKLWKFSDDRGMKPIFSSPCLADGRLYVGEGLYEDTGCKFYCVDGASGRKLWHFQTGGHTAPSPCVAGNRVFFAAGDDGVYSLDSCTGAKLWQFAGVRVHVSPALAGERLYAGTCCAETSEVFCLDTTTGRPHWRAHVDLPVMGSPAVAGDQVFFGLGNGTYLRGAERPAGALLCVEARTGRTAWRFEAADAVLARPATDAEAVYFGSRDGCCYCVGRRGGELRWRRPLGSAVAAAPVLLGRKLYVVSTRGRFCWLRVDSGDLEGSFDSAGHSQTKPLVYSTPALSESRIYFGAGLADLMSGFAPTVNCLRDRWAVP
jgi:outer membrane protein assembly factor BamB